MTEKPNWYNKLSRTKRKRVILANKRKRQKMTDSERELMRAKWRLAKQRQRKKGKYCPLDGSYGKCGVTQVCSECYL